MSGASERRWMARAIQLALRGLYSTDPNPRVGCVLVREGEVVGEGWHEQAGGPHAEVVALQQAGKRAHGASCYVTLEPCGHTGRTGPCTDALIAAGIKRLIAATEDPNPAVAGKGLRQLHEAGLDTHHGLLAAEARALNPGFFSRMQRGRPFVRLKQALSLDGRTALYSGESRWITCEAARADVQRLRARCSAILTGVGAVLKDNPRLNVRLETPRQPRRVILDSKLRTPADARLFEAGGSVIIFAAEGAQANAELQQRAHIEFVPQGEAGLNLASVLRRLAQLECNEVHVEGGATLAGALLQAAMVDEWVLYVAPTLLGQDGLPLARLHALESMQHRLHFTWKDLRRVGEDLKWTLVPVTESTSSAHA